MNPLRTLFDTAGFPPRWHCGRWTPLHGWTHVAADLLIASAYAAIPLVIAFYALRRRDLPHHRVAWLFVGFIASCGVTHLIDASLFWHPWYRLSALVKIATAALSWTTVLALVSIVPRALELPGVAELNRELAKEVEEHRQARLALEAANAALRAHEEELERRALELARSNEALEGFAHTASHDLLEPLRKITAFSTLLLEEKSAMLDAEGRDYVRIASDGALRMQSLVRGVLDIARARTVKVRLVEVDADAALDAARSDLAALLDERGVVVTSEAIGVVLAEAGQLDRVFQNLLSNAAKYRREGVTPTVEVLSHRDDEVVTITLRDNGIGLPEARLDELFVPFRRLHPEVASGSGIGLALCRRLVERWRGTLTAANVPGGGAAFTLTLLPPSRRSRPSAL